MVCSVRSRLLLSALGSYILSFFERGFRSPFAVVWALHLKAIRLIDGFVARHHRRRLMPPLTSGLCTRSPYDYLVAYCTTYVLMPPSWCCSGRLRIIREYYPKQAELLRSRLRFANAWKLHLLFARCALALSLALKAVTMRLKDGYWPLGVFGPSHAAGYVCTPA